MRYILELSRQRGECVTVVPTGAWAPALGSNSLALASVDVFLVSSEQPVTSGVRFTAKEDEVVRAAFVPDERLRALLGGVRELFRRSERVRSAGTRAEVCCVVAEDLVLYGEAGVEPSGTLAVGEDRPDLGRLPMRVALSSDDVAQLGQFLRNHLRLPEQ